MPLHERHARGASPRRERPAAREAEDGEQQGKPCAAARGSASVASRSTSSASSSRKPSSQPYLNTSASSNGVPAPRAPSSGPPVAVEPGPGSRGAAGTTDRQLRKRG